MNKLELKKNIFIRTKDGIVDKVTIDYKGKCNSPNCICKHVSCQYNYYDEVDIIKASHNIIDLIEEKDLLEIEYFSLRYKKRVTRLFEVTYKEGRFINLDNAKCQFMLIDNDWTDNDKELEPIIKSIVTHEQMEQMAYKVGE